ncbi:restriction endonuclease subunit S [Acinetobacter baumannii]|uniref:restriction endonuclease subunit S n=1 Tax=Acinetobacter baumannii TaxID=470 RepID=UPI0034E84801
MRIGDIKTDGSINLENCKYIPESLAVNSRDYLVEKNQLLMAMTGATIGKAGLYTSNQPAFLNQRVGKFELLAQNMNYRYLWYILKTDGYQEYIKLTAFGGAQPNISDTAMVDYPATIPSFDEQTQIANFLDHETSKIDHLIEKQQKLIELLKEKRQAVISHAVTKGLDPNVPMKDSGVAWLGEVPEHWDITPIRNLIRSGNLILQDGNHGELHPTANDYVETGIPFLMANNIRNGNLFMEDVKRIPKHLADTLRIGFAKAGDMLLTHKGTVGEVALVPQDIKEDYWMLTPQVTYYRWQGKKFLNKYFYYQFQSSSIQTQLEIIGAKQSTRAYVGLIAQGDLIVAIPPSHEQLEISSYILEKDQSYQLMIAKAQTAIQLMQERRTALISAAVTGKIDVRHWHAPTVAEAQTELSA